MLAKYHDKDAKVQGIKVNFFESSNVSVYSNAINN